MCDVFISYTSRGSTKSDWIMKFRENLQDEYSNTWKRKLAVWEMSENGPGADFDDVIDKVLDKTLVLIVVLDPVYMDSPQTKKEIKRYTEKRKAINELPIIIKVIKRNGAEDNELKNLIDRNKLAVSFSKTDANNIEVEFPTDSPEYQYQVKRIVNELWKHTVENRNKINAAGLGARLTEMGPIEKIYVAFGDRDLEDKRVKFINQLSDTLIHDKSKKLQEVKVVPDDFTISVNDFTYQDMAQLLCVPNESMKPCLDDILKVSNTIIIPIETDNEGEAEELLKRLSLQLEIIIHNATKENMKNKKVHILLNIPDILYDTPSFKQEFKNPAYATYANINIVKNQDIATFISNVIVELKNRLDPEVKPLPPDGKNIYFIDYNSKPYTLLSDELLKKEQDNKYDTVDFIAEEDFVVLTNDSVQPGKEIEDAKNQLQGWLSISKGIIIYRGIREDETWCSELQSATFKVLRELHKDELKRAVFVDPLQANRKKGAYSKFNYQVLLNNNPELKQFPDLKQFLCGIQQP